MSPTLTWQGSLFGTGEPTAHPDFPGTTRTWLDETSWVDVVPRWLDGSDDLFTALARRLAWTSSEMPMYGQLVRQPRLSAWWRLDDERVREPLLAHLAELIGRRYAVTFESIGANLYRDGRDSVAWHADRHAREPRDPDVVVPVLSLGSPRRFLLRPRSGGSSIAFGPTGGDLLVMGGACQRDWHHCVPKMASAQPRLSVTFRYETP